MNLVQLANDLEYVPKDQLAEMSQDPNASFPSYLVLAEIQRRTANEKAYAAAQSKPTTTVAEEVVGEFMQPKGLQAGMPPESAPTDSFSSGPTGMPASAPMQQPMQMAASGGLTGYAAGDRTALDRSFQQPEESWYDYISGAGESIGDWASDRYTDEGEGIGGLDYSNILSDASWLIPGGFIAKGIAGMGLKSLSQSGALKKGLDFVGRQGQRVYSSKIKPGPVVTSKTGQRFAADSTQGKMILNQSRNPPKILSREFSPTRVGIAGLAASPLINYALDDTPKPESEDKDKELTQEQKDYQALMDRINQANTNAASKKDKSTSFFSPTDLIQLGGTVMGAKNISELGQGIAGVAGLSSERKAAERKSGMEERYYKAQAGKLEAETALLPEKQIISEIAAFTAQLKILEEGGGDDVQKKQVIDYINYLRKELEKIRGYDSSMIAGNNKNLISSFT